MTINLTKRDLALLRGALLRAVRDEHEYAAAVSRSDPDLRRKALRLIRRYTIMDLKLSGFQKR